MKAQAQPRQTEVVVAMGFLLVRACFGNAVRTNGEVKENVKRVYDRIRALCSHAFPPPPRRTEHPRYWMMKRYGVCCASDPRNN